MKTSLESTTPGYMLVLSLMMIALVMIMVTSIVERARVHTLTMRVMLEREKARLLALSGLELAKSYLTNPIKPEKKEIAVTSEPKTADQQNPTQEAQNFLASFLPLGGMWREFTVVEGPNSTYGTIKIAIGCEDGKINLNQLYDFSKHKFIGEDVPQSPAKVFVEFLCTNLEKQQGGKGLFEKLTTFLKNRAYPLNDPTELLSIKEFGDAFSNALFLEPIDAPSETTNPSAAEKTKPRSQLYLTDIFTIWSSHATLDPWLFSPSVKQLFEIKQNTKNLDKILAEVLPKFALNASWQKDWDIRLKPLYSKDFASLPQFLASLLSTKFEPMVFSVVSYGSVKNVTQKMYAILERKRSSKKDGPLYEIVVKRLYWF